MGKHKTTKLASIFYLHGRFNIAATDEEKSFSHDLVFLFNCTSNMWAQGGNKHSHRLKCQGDWCRKNSTEEKLQNETNGLQ